MKALCVKSYSELQQLVAGQVQTVTASMVEDTVADNPESGMQKLVPYVVFYNMDVNAGKLKFIQYLRPGQVVEGSEEQGPGITSIGFGIPVQNLSDIRASEDIIGENGELSYAMTLGDIINTTINAGVREVEEQLGFKFLETLGPIIDSNQTAFFHSEDPSPELVNRIGMAIPIAVTAEQFERLRGESVFRPEHIEKLDTLGINVDLIVEQMDITPTINQVINELVGKYNLEPWSTMMFNYIARKELHEMMKDINYNDIVALVHAKKAALAQIAQETIAQEAATAAQHADQAQVEQGTVQLDQAAEVAQPVAVETQPAEEIKEESQDKPAA